MKLAVKVVPGASSAGVVDANPARLSTYNPGLGAIGCGPPGKRQRKRCD